MNKELKLNLGCGKRNFGENWIHIDKADFPHLHSHDIVNLPFEDNSVNLIYCSHCLEYFDRFEVIDVLNKWYKKLKPGGVLRLAVPNFPVMIKLYSENKYPLDNFLGPLYGRMKCNDEIIYHKTVYDFASLEKILLQCGFKNVRLYDWRQTEHATINDCSQACLPPDPKDLIELPYMDKEKGISISLNVECNKL